MKSMGNAKNAKNENMLFVNLSVVWAWGIDLSFDNNPPFLLKMNLLYEIPRYNTVLRYLVPRYIIQVLP